MTIFDEPEIVSRLGLPRKGLRTALCIAGLDPSGGAGILADLKAFEALGVFGMAVAATLTYQSTLGVAGRFDVPGKVVLRQLEELFADRVPNAVKTGALGGADTVRETGLFLEKKYEGPLVVDPVFTGSSGGALADEGAAEAVVRHLLPRAAVITPNAGEASLLGGFDVSDVKDAEAAALRLVALGARAALVTGIRTNEGAGPRAVDVFCDGEEIDIYSCPWIEGLNVHGTGCVLSAAVAACLARGMTLKDAIVVGRDATRAAASNSLATGRGAPSACLGGAGAPASGEDARAAGNGLDR